MSQTESGVSVVESVEADRAEVESGAWVSLSPGLPDLFPLLRALGEAEAYVHVPIGTERGFAVSVPAASLSLRGRLEIRPGVDRFCIHGQASNPGEFAWFGRRKGRGRPDYWQFAVERRGSAAPELVVYGTARLDGFTLRVRSLGPPPEREESDPAPGGP